MDLPTRYNLNFRWLDGQGLGPGGAAPVLIHFADPEAKERLFNATSSDPLWSYLCYQPQHPGLQIEREQRIQSEHVVPLDIQAGQEQYLRPGHVEPQDGEAGREHHDQLKHAELQAKTEQDLQPQHSEQPHAQTGRDQPVHARSALRSIDWPGLHRHAPLADNTQD